MPVGAVDDLAVILGLLESGKISATDAEHLLEALHGAGGTGASAGKIRAELVVTGELEAIDQPATLDIEVPTAATTLQAVPGSEARVVVAAAGDAARRVSRQDLENALPVALDGRGIALRPMSTNLAHLRHLTVDAFLPRQATWSGRVCADNGPIHLAELHCGELHVETTNGRVTGAGISIRNLSVATTNGGIELDRFQGRATLRTGNGAITIRLGQATPEVEDPHCLADGVELDVNAVMGSGSFHIHVPGGVATDVTATTSGGRIEANGPVQQRVSLTGTLRWRTPDWDSATRRVRLAVRTSNGSIRIAYASKA